MMYGWPSIANPDVADIPFVEDLIDFGFVVDCALGNPVEIVRGVGEKVSIMFSTVASKVVGEKIHFWYSVAVHFMAVTLSLKSSAGTPLHRKIYEEWREGILTGRFRRGERVPSSRELAATLGIAQQQ